MDSDKNISIDSSEEYRETLAWLYSQLPMFSRIGAAAYKPGLQTSEQLDEFFGHPHRKFKSIHIGGTNGKGSVSHLTASILMSQGYKVGLYTSPHLVDFRERIRINGEMIPRDAVSAFIRRFRESGYEGKPSFFELTMMMAFDWFAANNIDYGVIEVGMGGRLDSTNIISPFLCVITNISPDHMQFLGDTIEKIAGEKAGIIKKRTPVVVGEADGITHSVFRQAAERCSAPIVFAEESPLLQEIKPGEKGGWDFVCKDIENFHVPLGGEYQKKNVNTTLHVVNELRNLGIYISSEAERKGFENVVGNTGLQGRWQIISESPLTICDTGHNIAGITYNMKQLDRLMRSGRHRNLRMVIGFVNDKDVGHIVEKLPKGASFYLTQASVPRAMPVEDLKNHLLKAGISGRTFSTVKEAAMQATHDASPDDIIFIGGSTFVVADFLMEFTQ